MDYQPNIDGVIWFSEKVFPLLLKAHPELKFFIVGNNPTQKVKNLERNPSIKVTGYVQEVTDYLASSSIVVVPLFIARGIQNKILEALSMGRAVVATLQANEGVNAKPGSQILIAENAHEFSEAVQSLLENPSLALKIGQNGRRHVERHFRWEKNLEILDDLMRL